MNLELLIDAWQDGNLPDDFELLFNLKQQTWSAGRKAFEACQITDNAVIAELLIQEQIIMTELHQAIDAKMRKIGPTVEM